MKYYRKMIPKSDTYHWHKNCSKVPDDVETNPNWRVYTSPLAGCEKCNECKAKD